MEDVIGAPSDSARFAAFLADWETILARRVEQAAAAFAAIDGVRGLVLAGGIGRGKAWPLSDIDLIPMYDDDRFQQARDEVERARVALLRPWSAEGWWTGLDIGRLAFRRSEVIRVLDAEVTELDSLLADDRWYHSPDKGYRGQAIFDPDGIAVPLAAWFTGHRFHPSVWRFRLERTRGEAVAAQLQVEPALMRGDLLEATKSVRQAVTWWQAWWLECWGESDASQARVGTRFATLGEARSRSDIVTALNTISDLDDALVDRRMATAPAWVWERHDRSWRARRLVGETVTRKDDARDVLRVCSLYESRRPLRPPFPAWLDIAAETQTVRDKVDTLDMLVRQWRNETKGS